MTDSKPMTYLLRLPSGHTLTFPVSGRWEPASEQAFDALRANVGAVLVRVDGGEERVLAERVEGARGAAKRMRRAA